jgi:hypothetical protein
VVNLVDVGVLLILGTFIWWGIRRGIVGMALLLCATIISLVVAAGAAYLVATEAEAESGLARLAAPVAFFVALALASWLLKRVAHLLTRVIHGLPFASIDRLAGAVLAVAVAVVITSLLMLGLTSIPIDNPLSSEVLEARFTPLILWAGGSTAEVAGNAFAFLKPFARHYQTALERVRDRTRSTTRTPAASASLHGRA